MLQVHTATAGRATGQALPTCALALLHLNIVVPGYKVSLKMS